MEIEKPVRDSFIRKNSLVSVLMPAYNAGKFIKEAIDSIIDQSYQNWELLICDDGSTDHTPKILDSYQDTRIKTFINPTNQGYLKTTNQLFDQCQGEFIAFQDADDYSHRDRLKKQLMAFDEDKELGICGTNAVRIDKKDRTLSIVEKPGSNQDLRSNLHRVNPFVGSSIMIKQEVLVRIGGYGPFFDGLAYQDYDWAWLILEQYKGLNLDEAYYYYRQHANSNSKSVSLKRRVSNKLVQALGHQRKITGSDAIMENDKDAINKMLTELEAPYINDKSLLYLEYANDFAYAKMFPKATFMAYKALVHQPLRFSHYKLLLYCLFRLIIR